jgi:geranylgeranyl pyrophosphate synthase
LKLLQNDFNQKDFDEILSQITGNGGVTYARRRAIGFGEKALSHLSELKDSKYKKALQDLVGFVINRDK